VAQKVDVLMFAKGATNLARDKVLEYYSDLEI
jgi:hypothetical protein